MCRALVVAFLLALGCSSDSIKNTPSDGAACARLDRAECLASKSCTMHWVETSRYECRVSAGVCEENLVQKDRGGCEARDGCAWTNANCYCPFPGYGRTQVEDKGKRGRGACVCGGGPPPMCAPK